MAATLILEGYLTRRRLRAEPVRLFAEELGDAHIEQVDPEAPAQQLHVQPVAAQADRAVPSSPANMAGQAAARST